MGYVPYNKIIGAGLSSAGAMFGGDADKYPGGTVMTGMTGGVNSLFAPTSTREEIDKNWLQEFGDSMRGNGQEVQMERRFGDLAAGEYDSDRDYSRDPYNPDHHQSPWAQRLGGLTSQLYGLSGGLFG